MFRRMFSTRSSSQIDRFRSIVVLGDGIGPKISKFIKEALIKVDAAPVLTEVNAACAMDYDMSYMLICGSKCCLKGSMFPRKEHVERFNNDLREDLCLSVNARPYYLTLNSKGVDLITISESMEGHDSQSEYQEHVMLDFLRESFTSVAEYSFDYAMKQNRGKVSIINEIGFMPKTDKLFLQACQDVARNYSEIHFEEIGLKDVTRMLLKNAHHFDVLAMPSYYGDHVTNICTTLFGGSCLTPSYYIGKGGIVVAEGLDDCNDHTDGEDLVNPIALLLSTVAAMRHLGFIEKAKKLEHTILKAVAHGGTMA